MRDNIRFRTKSTKKLHEPPFLIVRIPIRIQRHVIRKSPVRTLLGIIQPQGKSIHKTELFKQITDAQRPVEIIPVRSFHGSCHTIVRQIHRVTELLVTTPEIQIIILSDTRTHRFTNPISIHTLGNCPHVLPVQFHTCRAIIQSRAYLQIQLLFRIQQIIT